MASWEQLPPQMRDLFEQLRTDAEHRAREQGIHDGLLDFNSGGYTSKEQCSIQGIHCWTRPQQEFFLDGRSRHVQTCLLCGVNAVRDGKRKRTLPFEGSEVCLSKARKAKQAFRRCAKLIRILLWWKRATYAPPSLGGAGYRRVQQEAVARGMR